MEATVTTMVLALRTLPAGTTARTVPSCRSERCRWTRTVSPSSCSCWVTSSTGCPISEAAATSTVTGASGSLASGDGLRVTEGLGSATGDWLAWTPGPGPAGPAALAEWWAGPGNIITASTASAATAAAAEATAAARWGIPICPALPARLGLDRLGRPARPGRQPSVGTCAVAGPGAGRPAAVDGTWYSHEAAAP